MEQQNQHKTSNRFWSNTVTELQEANDNPIFGYQDVPIMSLEDAVKSITRYVPNVQNYAEKAIEKRRQNTHLTRDESAAIYLYTMPNDFYCRLNEALRFKNRDVLNVWLPFLKLFFSALKRLPSCLTTVWRGVGDNFGLDFVEGREHTWCCVNSCSPNQNVARCFADSKGILFCIHAVNGKDITKYSAQQEEEEIILMPGTRLRVKSTWHSDLSTVVLEECTLIPTGQHVMLSYHSKAQEIIAKIRRILQSKHIRIWFDERGDMKEDNMYDSLANGVENAAVVCCFLTSDYEKSEICKLELQYAHKRRKPIIPCVLNDAQLCKSFTWLKPIIENFKCVDIHDTSELNIQLKTQELIDYISQQCFASQYLETQSMDRSSYLFELIKYNYICNSIIERFMNPSKSFPIKQSYISLVIVETKEQQNKEKKLHHTQNIDVAMGTFEQIYGSKTPIDVKDIFNTCKDQTRKVLVFGRAGIGKSTFCRYVAYQWATGALWSEYELVVLIPLRSLTEQDYQVGINYYLVDILKKQYFSNRRLSVEDEKLLEEQIRTSRVLWLLDGYDEIIQNQSAHIQRLINQLLDTPNHIVTSRPYMNTLPYPVQMEIIGFTDKNIGDYVKQFFDQLGNESQYLSAQDKDLLSFLKLNYRIWAIAHIPINLELICSVWSNTDWTQTKTITMTVLYDELTEWICRRYLEKQRGMSTSQIKLMSKIKVYQYCHNELVFLQTLAFYGMESNAILLSPKLLEKAGDESNCSLIDHPHLLNIGILKSCAKHGIGTAIEPAKDHYFVHLSFQEYFAARYLAKALQTIAREKAIDFIRKQKYNQRFRLLFIFASSILLESGEQQCIDKFWEIILNEPIDLVRIRHMDLVICCFDETYNTQTLIHHNQPMDMIIQWIEHAFSIGQDYLRNSLTQTLRSCNTICNEPEVQMALIRLLTDQQKTNVYEVLSFISFIPLTHPIPPLVDVLLLQIKHTNASVRIRACNALGNMSGNTEASEVINRLVSTFGDEDYNVRSSACDALGKIGEKTATNEVIDRLVNALDDNDPNVRFSAFISLDKMGEKSASSKIIKRLVTALDDKDFDIRRNACATLYRLGERAAVSEVISRLVTALDDEDAEVKSWACYALGKMGEKGATGEVVNQLVTLLGDKKSSMSAYVALSEISKKAATSEMIKQLTNVLDDKDPNVRRSAYRVLSEMDKKPLTNEMINRFLTALDDTDFDVRALACRILSNIDGKAVTSEVINRLVSVLDDKVSYVKVRACEILGSMGEKAAISEVINRLVSVLDDTDSDTRKAAYDALGKMGAKGATNEIINQVFYVFGHQNLDAKRIYHVFNEMGEKAAMREVINRLMSALDDKDSYVGICVCAALGKMGENAAESEVINRLISALDDEAFPYRDRVCQALGKMGEKAITSEVISRLVSALDDKNSHVRMSVCEALANMGEKAATSEMINRLVSVLKDKELYVRIRACEALGKMGKKAATNEAISQLVSALKDAWFNIKDTLWQDNVRKYLSVLSSLAVFYDKEVSTTDAMMIRKRCLETKLISPRSLLKVYMSATESIWLPAVVYALLISESAVIVIENTILVYEKEGIMQIPITNKQLFVELREAFTEQLGKVYLDHHEEWTFIERTKLDDST